MSAWCRNMPVNCREVLMLTTIRQVNHTALLALSLALSGLGIHAQDGSGWSYVGGSPAFTR